MANIQQVGEFQYDLTKQIGRGSFADVFKGTAPDVRVCPSQPLAPNFCCSC
jgi:hypothetical protein